MTRSSFTEVRCGTSAKIRIIAKVSEAYIAAVTKQSSNDARLMTMIHVPIPNAGFGAATERALEILIMKHPSEVNDFKCISSTNVLTPLKSLVSSA